MARSLIVHRAGSLNADDLMLLAAAHVAREADLAILSSPLPLTLTAGELAPEGGLFAAGRIPPKRRRVRLEVVR